MHTQWVFETNQMNNFGGKNATDQVKLLDGNIIHSYVKGVNLCTNNILVFNKSIVYLVLSFNPKSIFMCCHNMIAAGTDICKRTQ